MFMSFVGYDCNLENPPLKIDSIVLPEEQEKFKEVIEKAKNQFRERKNKEKEEYLARWEAIEKELKFKI